MRLNRLQMDKKISPQPAPSMMDLVAFFSQILAWLVSLWALTLGGPGGVDLCEMTVAQSEK